MPQALLQSMQLRVLSLHLQTSSVALSESAWATLSRQPKSGKREIIVQEAVFVPEGSEEALRRSRHMAEAAGGGDVPPPRGMLPEKSPYSEELLGSMDKTTAEVSRRRGLGMSLHSRRGLAGSGDPRVSATGFCVYRSSS